MTIEHTTTFKAATSKRPAITDLRYAQKKNDVSGGPIPPDGPSAEEWDQVTETAAAVARTAPIATLSILNGASPTIDTFTCVRDDVSSTVFTLYSPSTGVCEITWPAGNLPVSATKPLATINGSTPGMITTELITNGVRVRTFNGGESPAYRDFTVGLP